MAPKYDRLYNLTPEQLASEQDFQLWVLEPDESRDLFWSDFLQVYPERAIVVDQARTLVERQMFEEREMAPLSSEEKADVKALIFSRLELPADTVTMKPRPGAWRWWASVAAAVLLAGSVFVLSIFHKKNGLPAQEALATVRTGTGETKRILLSDSTAVILNASSSLTYGASSRQVQLTGNAYFIVQKNMKADPFTVQTASMTVTVLGTELNVNARSQATEVTLTKGRVKVEANTGRHDPEYLKPGEKITIDTSSDILTKTTANPQLYTAWTKGQWVFQQTSLEDIAGLLSDYYGVQVHFSHPVARHLRMNGIIAVGPIDKLLPVLAATFRLKMELSNNQINID